MPYVEIETGRYVKRWAFWNPATWSIPKLYWDAWSQEQRLHAICRQLEKVIKYADYLGVNVDDIAARLKAIEEGQLDPLIEAAIEAWFEDNEPAIVNAINLVNAALPIEEFDADNTVKDALDAIETEIAEPWRKTYINVLAHGIVNDGTTDNYDALQELIFDVSDAGGGCLYFPAGTYNVSNTIVIDDDVSLIGDGSSSVIYGTGTDFHRFGTVLAIIGNNVSVKNLKGSYYNEDALFYTNNYNFGFIGIGGYTRSSLLAYINNETNDLVTRHTENVLIDTLWCDGHYPLQTENVDVYNVVYNNIYAPNGTVSFMNNAGYNSGRYTATNIVCAFFRAQDTSGNSSFCCNIENVICEAFFSNFIGANISNVYIDYKLDGAVAQWIWEGTYDSIYLNLFQNCTLTNLTVDLHDVVLDKTKLRIGAVRSDCEVTNISFRNCENCTTTTQGNFYSEVLNGYHTRIVNANFDKLNSDVACTFTGRFVNCSFGSVSTAGSNIKADNHNRNLTALTSPTVSSPSAFATYANYFYRQLSTVQFNYTVQFTATTLSSSTPDYKLVSFNHDLVKPKNETTANGFVLVGGDWVPAIFAIKTDGIYLEYFASATFTISRMMVNGTYIALD